MSDQLQGKRIAFLVANEGVEQVELTSRARRSARPAPRPTCSPPTDGEVQAFNHLDKGDTFEPDRAVGEADPDDYDGLVLPGRRRQPRPAAHRHRTRSSSSARSSRRASRSGRSATARGR